MGPSEASPWEVPDSQADRRRLHAVLGLGDATAMLMAVAVVLTTVGHDGFNSAGLLLAPIAAVIGLWAVHFQGVVGLAADGDAFGSSSPSSLGRSASSESACSASRQMSATRGG